MKKMISILLVLIVGAGAILLASCTGEKGSIENGLGSFSSREQIINRIKAYEKLYNVSNLFSKNDIFARDNMDVMQESDYAASNGAGDDYTRTNTQVEGVDEGDIIKVDGANIYILNQSGFYIVRTIEGELETLCEIKLGNYVPYEMYLDGDTLILIGGIYVPDNYYNSIDLAIVPGCRWYPGTQKTDIRLYDISDRTAPVLTRQQTIWGNYNTSRLIDGTLYYIINYYFYCDQEETYFPKISDSAVDGGAEKEIDASNIKFFEDIPNYNYLITGSIRTSGADAMLQAYLGAGNNIYVSGDNLYVTSTDYSANYIRKIFSVTYDYSGKAKTRIIRIRLQDLAFTGKTTVEGTVKDRYSLDEYNGYLRVATTTSYYTDNKREIYSSVFVLDGDLRTVGTITNIAPGETIYAVRFNKEEGSIVTFVQTDPLFKLNLSDPTNPTISEGLKKDGVSYYLHYIEGTDYVIGLGRDTIVNQNGFTEWKGLEVVLYDYSGAEAVILGRYVIGNACSYAEALYNPKAILYDKDRDLFAFAAEEWFYEPGPYYYGSYYQAGQSLYVFGFSTGELTLKAKLTDIGPEMNYDDWYDYYNYCFSFIKRGARIGNHIYTISDRYVTSYSLADFSEVDKLELAEYTVTSYGVYFAD
jgi:uncharacterized secreted protein with C-terminal beta-propeller domain